MRTLEITSFIGCPVGCPYCPQRTLKSAYEGKMMMDMTDFRTLFHNVPLDVRIDFSGFSEIFCHPDGAKMIRYCYDSGYQVVLYTTLTGFKQQNIETLRNVQFTDLCFHLAPQLDAADFSYKRNLFETHIGRGRIAVITDQWKWSRAGNVWDRQEKKGPFKCLFAEKDFDHNVVLPNGEVYLCCQDYGLKHCIGNLFETHFNRLNREDYMMLSNEYDSDIICRKCEIAQYL